MLFALVLPILAEVDTASAIWGGIATLVITKFFDWLMLREQNRQLTRKIEAVGATVSTAATELNTKADTAAVKADTAATKASEASSLAKKAAHNTVAVFNATKAQDAKLATIERQTNGVSDAKDAVIEEQRAKIEALLLLVPPEKADEVAEKLSASKSGTKLKAVAPKETP